MRAYAAILPLMLGVFAIRFFPSVFTPPSSGATTDFGSGGILTDVVIESTTDAGVLMEGVGFEDEDIDWSGAAVAANDARILLKDNLNTALVITEAGNPLTSWITANGSERVLFERRLTTTDGVASGTPRIVGGQSFASSGGSTAILGTNEALTNFDVTTDIPANTIGAGTTVNVQASGICTVTNAAETLQLSVMADAVEVGESGAYDPANNDVWVINFSFTGQTPGVSGTVIGAGDIFVGGRGLATAAKGPLATGSGSTSTATVDTTQVQTIGIGLDYQTTTADTTSCRLDRLVVGITG